MLKRFGVPPEGLELKIESRGVPPHGGGEIILSIPVVQDSLKVSTLTLLFFLPFSVSLCVSIVVILYLFITRRLSPGLMKAW